MLEENHQLKKKKLLFFFCVEREEARKPSFFRTKINRNLWNGNGHTSMAIETKRQKNEENLNQKRR